MIPIVALGLGLLIGRSMGRCPDTSSLNIDEVEKEKVKGPQYEYNEDMRRRFEYMMGNQHY